ncbi:unnamed protein product [Allacma fusca]|uniref:FERM domain-containing protein n=1 Tax=Allacma fusca TaxID=39272 RepID=A0A8J2PA30_9HEXA|nr:unnamed protein product [Allacma fusca]
MIRRNSKSDIRSGQQVTIRLLDDNEVLQVDIQTHHKGQFLVDYICRQLNIAEKDYFGLRFVDSSKQRHWLNLGKSIVKQLKEIQPYIVCLRFKFYPSDPMLLKEEVSRYQLVLQMRRDILHGRLYSTLSDMATLASFILQSELGDYDPEVHLANYAGDYELVSRQSPQLEEKAMELHQKLKGLTPSETDILFLKKAATLDTYGVDPHPVKDQQGEQVYLGINHTGISTFQGSRKSTHFKWTQITKLNYEAKMFIIHLSIAEDARTKKKETVGFKCQTSSACKYLWRCAVEQRLFFNCGCSNEIPSAVRGGGLFFGSKFRYSGRVQREILEDPGPLRAIDGVIQRTPLYRSLQRNKTRSLPHSPMQTGYGSLPRSNHSAPLHESTRLEGAMGTLGSSTSLPLSTLSSPYCPEHTLPLLETLQEDSPRIEDKEDFVENIGDNDNIDKSSPTVVIATTDPVVLTTEEVKTGPSVLIEEARSDDYDISPSVVEQQVVETKILENHLAFDPVYHGNDASEGMGLMEDRLKESRINQASSLVVPGQLKSSPSMIVSVWKIFLVCLACVLIALLLVAILAIEVDVDICRKMRRIPEVEIFQTELYEPLKYFLRDKFHNLTTNLNLPFH